MTDAIAVKDVEETKTEDGSIKKTDILSGDLVIGLIGYAGAGCTDVLKRLREFLEERNFEVHSIKLSKFIAACSKEPIPEDDGANGDLKLDRSISLQNLGDKIREMHGGEAVSYMAVKEIKNIRQSKTEKRKAIIIDSIKHPNEIELLRIVYENSFLLVGVYCGRELRESRLKNKYYGAPAEKIQKFMKRDEKDAESKLGQQVRKAFHQSDFFLDNSKNAQGHEREYDHDLRRFTQIMEGVSIIRPTNDETAMYHAYAASLRSSCLSRQVGAALANASGELLATGTNEVPTFGGGVYHDAHEGEANRCFKWKWWDNFADDDPEVAGKIKEPCCHNTRKKNDLKENISSWMKENLPLRISQYIYPLPSEGEFDLKGEERLDLQNQIESFMGTLASLELDSGFLLDGLPGISDLVEFSRSIHAEMDALLTAARIGASTEDSTIYVTAYPCHNCARHLVASGVRAVRFLEPYDKSLAVTLHWDSIENEGDGKRKMSISSYTGVGPRVYEKYFLKKGEIKNSRTGVALPPEAEASRVGVRLWSLETVEEMAIKRIPDKVEVEP